MERLLECSANYNRRVVNLAQRLRIHEVGLRDNVATELRDALELSAQVGVFLPGGDGLGGVLGDAADLEQLRLRPCRQCQVTYEVLRRGWPPRRRGVVSQLTRLLPQVSECWSIFDHEGFGTPWGSARRP